jgi:pimeloyl-ACP methyl ester carboxylesterase
VEPDRRNWGVKGVSCLLKTGRECVPAAKVFWDLIQSLERAGYRAGETLFGVPFDWRFGPDENHFCADLARMLHTVTNRTSHRKSFLVAHSLGNLQILHCIQRVFGMETISKIKALVSIAAPWAGAPKAARVLVSGDEMLDRNILSDADIRDFSRKLSAVYMLLPDEKVRPRPRVPSPAYIALLPSLSLSLSLSVCVCVCGSLRHTLASP